MTSPTSEIAVALATILRAKFPTSRDEALLSLGELLGTPNKGASSKAIGRAISNIADSDRSLAAATLFGLTEPAGTTLTERRNLAAHLLDRPAETFRRRDEKELTHEVASFLASTIVGNSASHSLTPDMVAPLFEVPGDVPLLTPAEFRELTEPMQLTIHPEAVTEYSGLSYGADKTRLRSILSGDLSIHEASDEAANFLSDEEDVILYRVGSTGVVAKVSENETRILRILHLADLRVEDNERQQATNPQLPRPDKEPETWGMHPWLGPHKPAEAAAVLKKPARVCWLAREVHSSFEQLGRSISSVEERSPMALDGRLLEDPWSYEIVRSTLDALSAIAVNNLAGAAALVWSGEQLFGEAVLIRAALEASVAAMWILEPAEIDEKAPAEAQIEQWRIQASARAARAHLLTFNDYARSIKGSPKGDARASAKRRRKTYLRRLEKVYGADAIIMHQGGTLIAELAHIAAPTFDGMFDALNDRLEHDGEWISYYENLSRLSHPSPGIIRDFYASDGEYKHDPEETKRLMWVGVFGYTTFLKHAVGYCFGDRSDGDEFLQKWEDLVAQAWPDFFESAI